MSVIIDIVGYGLIGKAVAQKVVQKGWSIRHVVKSDGLYKLESGMLQCLGDRESYAHHMLGVDLAFIAIPTKDNGEAALRYIGNYLSQADAAVVTCEKGALSNHFHALQDRLDRIGFSASAGGGTRLIKFIADRNVDCGRPEMHAVLNGTLNFVFDEMGRGDRTIGEAVDEAARLGYAEPGNTDVLAVINGEIRDTVMKAAVVFNTCRFSLKPVRAMDVKCRLLDRMMLDHLLLEAGARRYIVSFTHFKPDDEAIGGFSLEMGDWWITGGFRELSANPLYAKVLPHGADNAVLIYEGQYGEDGSYRLSGPGAGPKPTARSMILDAEHLLETK